jgi:hypothetical protein
MVATVFAATAILSPPVGVAASRRSPHVPRISSPFRTIFHRVEVPEQGDSIAPTHAKEMRSPFARLKRRRVGCRGFQAVNDCLQSLSITRREIRNGSSPPRLCKTRTTQECAELFYLLPPPDSIGQHYWFSD